MANINKLRISGTTYNIQDENATKTVELTQAQYDALSTKDPNTFYIITDAAAGDLSNYYTKTETDDLLDTKLDVTAYTPTDLTNYYTKSETSGATEISTALASKADTAITYTKTEVDNAITAATSTKQDQLISGTNIKTINNESILGSGNITIEGGSSYTAGRGISIANDTISFSLPISATTNNNLIIGDNSNSVSDPNNAGKNIVFGRYSVVKAYDSLVGGYSCSNEKGQSQVFGSNSKTKNNYEFGCGRYNNSVTTSTTFGDSGNTLFSVGNGTADNARHNAFEIRQNGDIYLTKDGQDVKLQDQLGGGSSITVDSALSSTSENPVQNKVIYQAIGDIETLLAAI